MKQPPPPSLTPRGRVRHDDGAARNEVYGGSGPQESTHAAGYMRHFDDGGVRSSSRAPTRFLR
jgi:hypothetical protein